MKIVKTVAIAILGLLLAMLALGFLLSQLDPKGWQEAQERVAAEEAREAREAALEEAEKKTKSDAEDIFPHTQKRFHALNDACNARYDTGINEIQKSLAFNECNRERVHFSNGNQVVKWVGELTSIDTDQGADIVSIRIESTVEGFEIEYVSSSNHITESISDSVIRPGSLIFNQLASMKEGDLIAFTAEFEPNGDGGLAELSMTEKGSLRSPVFSMKFIDITPLE